MVLLFMLGGAGTGALLVLAQAPDAVLGCSLGSERARVFGRDSFVYARDGSLLGAVPTSRNREPVPLARMSPWLPRATVAIEDRRFWSHGPLDYRAILRAALANLRAGRVVQGGSTLTQQLVRHRYLGDHRRLTLARKLHEACLAIQLGRAWSKTKILQAYLNLVFYGHHAYGAEAAAHTYFGRSARDLTLGQAALLAGLPQAPSAYDPFRHPAAARARRNDVLSALRATGAISARRYRGAAASPLHLHRGRRYVRVRASAFFADVVRELRRRFGPRARRGGLRVNTTLDLGLQRDAQRAIRRWLHRGSGPGAALVAIDPRSGAVRALATTSPGRPGLRFNLATQSRRQAGSAFKVFTLTAALERGIALRSVWNGPPSLTITRRRCQNAGGPWVVRNFADESAGRMTLQNATAHSVNTIFAQLVVRVGPARVADVARRMGIRSPLKPVCSITLGPLGVSPLEMTTAFATLAARGVRHDAQLLRGVAAANGTPLLRPHRKGVRALPRRVADRVTRALEGVVRKGTGRAADPGRPAAGKTGTAQGFRDAWFCGYVRRLAACVWVGYPRAEIPLRNIAGFAQVVGGSIPARIWHDFIVAAMRRTITRARGR